MRKLCLLGLALAFAGNAYAAPNVTNATQKGSLLIWPDIRIDNGWNTLIRNLRLASSTFSDLPDDRILYVEGTAALLDDAGGLTVQTLQALLAMIEEKQKLLQLLNEYIDGPGLSVVIGAEHLDPNLRPFSLVLSTYDDGSGIGSVGVIGPTRMRYSRAIAAVDGAAQAVSRMLKDPD